jgi:hypothetical protein
MSWCWYPILYVIGFCVYVRVAYPRRVARAQQGKTECIPDNCEQCKCGWKAVPPKDAWNWSTWHDGESFELMGGAFFWPFVTLFVTISAISAVLKPVVKATVKATVMLTMFPFGRTTRYERMLVRQHKAEALEAEVLRQQVLLAQQQREIEAAYEVLGI